MGIVPDAGVDLARPIDFEPGDLFVLLTDGFTEWARRDGEQYGQERLIATVLASKDQSCAALIRTIYQDVLGFVGKAPQLDDLTAIVIKRTG